MSVFFAIVSRVQSFLRISKPESLRDQFHTGSRVSKDKRRRRLGHWRWHAICMYYGKCTWLECTVSAHNYPINMHLRCSIKYKYWKGNGTFDADLRNVVASHIRLIAYSLFEKQIRSVYSLNEHARTYTVGRKHRINFHFINTKLCQFRITMIPPLRIRQYVIYVRTRLTG